MNLFIPYMGERASAAVPKKFMAIVPGYLYDVFISYAHADNEPVVGDGWVTDFAGNLKRYVERNLKRLGALEPRGESLSVWMDYRLRGHQPVTQTIHEALRQSAVLVIILSPDYLASEWCRQEREIFLSNVRERTDSGSRSFIVQFQDVGREAYPAEFNELIGYSFWAAEEMGRAPRTLGFPNVRCSPDPEYFNRLNDLSNELAEQLSRLRNAPRQVVGPAQPAPEGPLVFLADVTEDLDPLREETKRYLVQSGIRVLPETWYPRDDAQAFQSAVDRDMGQCLLFVQLLNGTKGRTPPGLSGSYASFQYERALHEGKPMMQWRSRELDIDSVVDEEHRRMLLGGTVRACGLEEFKGAVVEEIKRLRKPLRTRRPDAFIFVNTNSSDYNLARKVAEVLQRHDVGYAMPLSQGGSEELRQDLENNLRDCDGLIVIYGETPVSWVRQQLRQGRKIMSDRTEPLRALAIFEGPPSPKASVDFSLPGMRTLTCHNGLDEAVLLDFLEGF